MSMKGKVNIDFGTVIPHANPPIKKGARPIFTNISYLGYAYISDPGMVAKIVPDIFEIDEKPMVKFDFYNHRMTKNGGYREAIFHIAVKYKGEDYSYSPIMYVSNEVALIAGREVLGVPKLIAAMDIDPLRERPDSIMYGTISRPAEVPLAYATFRPNVCVGLIGEAEMPTEIPFPGTWATIFSVPGICQLRLTGMSMAFVAGEVWEGKGSLKFTGFSDIDDIHNMPVVEMLDSKMILNGTMELAMTGPQQKVINLAE